MTAKRDTRGTSGSRAGDSAKSRQEVLSEPYPSRSAFSTASDGRLLPGEVGTLSIAAQGGSIVRLSTRDLLATVLVGIGGLLYLAWLLGMNVPWFTEVRAVAIALLIVGIGASMSAVVPGFAQLLRGPRAYFAAASLLGLVAFLGGLWAIFAQEPLGLAVLVVATLILWAMSTWRHAESAGALTS